jgi:hypothetical protein
MGFFSKILLLLILVIAVGFSAWIIALPIIIYELLPILQRKRRSHRGESRSAGSMRISWRYLAGGVLLALSVVALNGGGRLSVVIFQASGWLTLLIGLVLNSLTFARVEVVRESTLVRSVFFPFSWFCVAEVKTTGSKLASAIATTDNKIVIQIADGIHIYAITSVFSFTRSGADSAIGRKLRTIAKTLGSIGTYILPLDSMDVITTFSMNVKRQKVEEKAWPASLESTPFDILALTTKHGFLKSVSAYRIDEARNTVAVIPPTSQTLLIQPLFWEVLDLLDKRVGPNMADSQTAFLASLYAARSVTMGEVLESVSGDSTSLLVKSLSSPAIQLTRAQVRTLMRTYGFGSEQAP